MSKDKATPVAEAWKHYEWMYGINVIRVVKWNGGAYLLARDGAPFGSHAGLTKIPIERPIDWPNDCEYWPEVTRPVEPSDVGRIALVDRGDNGIERRKIVYAMRHNGEPIKYVTVGNYGGVEENPVGSSPDNVKVVVSLSELDSQGEGEEAKNREWKLKCGDWVLITKPDTEHKASTKPVGCRWFWCEELDHLNGEVRQIIRITEEREGCKPGYQVKEIVGSDYWLDKQWLSPAEKPNAKTAPKDPLNCIGHVCDLAEPTGVTCPPDSCDLETGVREMPEATAVQEPTPEPWKPKVGDLVKVTKPSNVNELPRWIEPDMDKFDGQVGRVVDSRPGDRWVRLDLWRAFTFNPNWLSPVEETRGESPVSSMANAFAQADVFSWETMKQAESAAAMQHVATKAEQPVYVPKAGDWVRITKPGNDRDKFGWDEEMDWLDGRVILLQAANLGGTSTLGVIDPEGPVLGHSCDHMWLIDPAWCSPAEPTQADKDATFWLVDGKVYRLAGMEDAGRKAYISDLFIHPKEIANQDRRAIEAVRMPAENEYGEEGLTKRFYRNTHWWRYAWVPVEPDEPTKQSSVQLTECVAERDGDCDHEACPQLKDWKPHCPLDRLDTSEECSARGQAFFDPKEVTPEATPEVTQEVEYRDADHRDVGLEVQASSDKESWDVVPLLAVLPEGKKYRFITDREDDLFGGYKYARVPSDPMRDAPRDKLIEGYVGNEWIRIFWHAIEGYWRSSTPEPLDPVRWREVQK